MLIHFYKYNLKKKKFYYSLLLYFLFFKYKILYFVHLNILKCNINLNSKLKYFRVNSSYILSLLKKNKFNKFIFNIFKRNLLIIFSNNFFLLDDIINVSLGNNLMMMCLNYYFINVKYLSKLDIIGKLFLNNLNLYLGYVYILFFKIKYYVYFILKNYLKTYNIYS
jgi:hypothetical protein